MWIVRLPLVLAVLVLLLSIAPAARGDEAPATTRASGKKPNVVIVYIDDMGYGDLGVYGNPDVKTPNLDRLAAEGVRFTNYYTNSPICSPSRVAVMTGRSPQRYAIYGYLDSRASNDRRHMADWLDPEAMVLPRLMQDAGYATAHFGKWHMGGGRDVGDAPLPSAYGFDESLVSFEGLGDRILPLPKGGLSGASARLGRGDITWMQKSEITGLLVDRAIDFIDQHRDEPFYVHLWPGDVHDPFKPSADQLDAAGGIGRNEEWKKFYAVLLEMDRQLGRLFDHIDASGLGDDTLILVASDNGPTAWNRYWENDPDPLAAPGYTGGFRGRKWSLYEGGIRMPLIARWTGHTEVGAVDDSTIVAAYDLLPSITSLCGVELPAGYDGDGLDLSEALLGESQDGRSTPLFFEYNARGGQITDGLPGDRSPQLAVRDGDWKLLMAPDGSGVELYDLAADPAESTNVADDHPQVVDELQKATASWFEEVKAEGEATRERLQAE